MALINVDFFSKSLSRMTSFKMLLPNDLPDELKSGSERHYKRDTRTLYLLHGYSCHNIDWLLNSAITILSGKYNLAVVFPSGENSFYVDGKGTGKAYGQYIGDELVDYTRKVFGLSNQSRDTFIGGLSMGGFGALRNALKYNHTFGKAFALSSALIIHNIKNMQENTKDVIADYDYYHAVFGDLAKLDESDANPEYLVKKILRDNDTMPELYMACGQDDFLIEENRTFKAFLDAQNVPVKYTESVGVHDWTFWNEYLEPSIRWLLEE